MVKKYFGKLMCPKSCCGVSVKKCSCPKSCAYCNCHEIKKLQSKLKTCKKSSARKRSRSSKRRKTQRKSPARKRSKSQRKSRRKSRARKRSKSRRKSQRKSRARKRSRSSKRRKSRRKSRARKRSKSQRKYKSHSDDDPLYGRNLERCSAEVQEAGGELPFDFIRDRPGYEEWEQRLRNSNLTDEQIDGCVIIARDALRRKNRRGNQINAQSIIAAVDRYMPQSS
jgi:hypothetical protein